MDEKGEELRKFLEWLDGPIRTARGEIVSRPDEDEEEMALFRRAAGKLK